MREQLEAAEADAETQRRLKTAALEGRRDAQRAARHHAEKSAERLGGKRKAEEEVRELKADVMELQGDGCAEFRKVVQCNDGRRGGRLVWPGGGRR